MPVGEDVLRASDQEGVPPVVHEIRKHAEAVIEDHHRYKDVQKRISDRVKPPSFEHCLETHYEMVPHPLPEDEVPVATFMAVEALTQERESAGGRPSAETVVLPELTFEEQAETPPAFTEVVVEPAADVPVPPKVVLPPPVPLDFYELAKLVEERVSRRLEEPLIELGASIAGLGFRIDRIILQRADKPDAPETSVVALKVSEAQEKASGVSAPSGKPITLQERRRERSGWGNLPEGSSPGKASSGPQEGLGPKREGDTKGSPVPVRHLRVSKRVLWMAAGVLALVAAGSAGILFLGPLDLTTSPRSGRALVEAQVKGLGAYVRAEEGQLAPEARRREPLAALLGQLRNANQTAVGAQREENNRRIKEIEDSLRQAERAEGALRSLYVISGVMPSGQ